MRAYVCREMYGAAVVMFNIGSTLIVVILVIIAWCRSCFHLALKVPSKGQVPSMGCYFDSGPRKQQITGEIFWPILGPSRISRNFPVILGPPRISRNFLVFLAIPEYFTEPAGIRSKAEYRLK